MSTQWYQALYRDFHQYDQEPYTQHTANEVDFIESVLDFDHTARILDIGCGTGRHALELARRGYRVVGIDLSATMLDQARSKVEAQGLHVDWLQVDARALTFQAEFEAAIMLCEGGFSLMETDEMDRLILANAACALKPGGLLVMTAPNAGYMLAQAPNQDGFDPQNLRESFTLEKTDQQGNKRVLHCSQRYYTLPELRCILSQTGLQMQASFAVTGQGFAANQPVKPENFELGLVARKHPAHSARSGCGLPGGNDQVP